MMLKIILLALLLSTPLASPSAAKAAKKAPKEKIKNGMTHFKQKLRNSLQIEKTDFVGSLKYQLTFNCQFDFVMGRLGDQDKTGLANIAAAKVKNRIAVSTEFLGSKSSALMTDTGFVTNYNNIDPFTGTRSTMNNQTEAIARGTAEIIQRNPNATQIGFIKNSPITPQIVEHDGKVGSKFAVLNSNVGEWASYYYKGMTKIADWNAVVLDLIKTSNRNGKQTNFRIGFLVAERDSMAPLMFVFENYYRMKGIAKSCKISNSKQ